MNLHSIREYESQKKIENVLFDQFWYRNREGKQRRDRVKKANLLQKAYDVEGKLQK